jgi:hypothetical protein
MTDHSERGGFFLSTTQSLRSADRQEEFSVANQQSILHPPQKISQCAVVIGSGNFFNKTL